MPRHTARIASVAHRPAAARCAPVLLLAALAPGCASQPQGTEAERYLKAVSDSTLSLAEGKALCHSLTNADMVGDCMLALVSNVGRATGQGLGELCPEVPTGIWQDECWFVAAEGAGRTGDRENAAAWCKASGRFRDDCGQHLWQSEVRATIAPRRKGAPVPTFEEALPRAREIYAGWEPYLADETDFENRFWRRFYQNGFERRGWIELSRCDPLEPTDKTRCIDAGTHIFSQRIDSDLYRSGIDLCRVETLAGSVSQALRAAEHPVLEETLLTRRNERCRAGYGAAVPPESP